jgi:hypothetical protein
MTAYYGSLPELAKTIIEKAYAANYSEVLLEVYDGEVELLLQDEKLSTAKEHSRAHEVIKSAIRDLEQHGLLIQDRSGAYTASNQAYNVTSKAFDKVQFTIDRPSHICPL